MFSVSCNSLQGSLPPDLGSTLPNLRKFAFGQNQFSGFIPESLPNASKLIAIDIGDNYFSGPIPMNFGKLQYLQFLILTSNPLFTRSKQADSLSFFKSLTNCTNLVLLGADQVNLSGLFPDSIVNLSTKLTALYLELNSLSGTIPQDIENLVNLIDLAIDYNQLSGNIPSSVGKLINQQGIYLHGNKLSGKIPASIGNITSLSLFNLGNNMLEGTIPASLGNCTFLQYLDISRNNLTGAIPGQVLGIFSLSIGLNLSWNHLTGPLSSQVGKLINLGELDFAGNELSGEVPNSLGDCLMLEYLSIGGNHFGGTIPPSFETMKSMQVLDLSHNNLSGPIPMFLGNLSYLEYLDLSFNDFEGEVPDKGIFKNVSAFSILGNHKLCGGTQQLQLSSCPTIVSNNHRKHIALGIKILIGIGVVACAVLLSASIYVVCRQGRLSKEEKPSSGLQLMPNISCGELMEVTDGFSSTNLIGEGSFSSVYKGVLSQGKLVAVKLFKLDVQEAHRSFLAECKALKKIRHRNLVKIISCCSSIDSKGQDFKALVCEFMPNGNLDSWLHPSTLNQHKLKLMFRLNIAIDVANALDHLHHHCQEPVIPCDLKPSNVLLDDGLTAHVADFGLARLIRATTGSSSQSQMSSMGIRGTPGYVPPGNISVISIWTSGKFSSTFFKLAIQSPFLE